MANKNEMTRVKALEYVLDNYEEDMPADVVEKIKGIKASIEKKSTSGGKTKKEVKADEVLKAEIINVLTLQDKLRITDLLNNGDYSDYEAEAKKPITAQKLTATLTKMADEDKTVVKIVDKKVSYFSLAYTPEEEEAEEGEE